MILKTHSRLLLIVFLGVFILYLFVLSPFFRSDYYSEDSPIPPSKQDLYVPVGSSGGTGEKKLSREDRERFEQLRKQPHNLNLRKHDTYLSSKKFHNKKEEQQQQEAEAITATATTNEKEKQEQKQQNNKNENELPPSLRNNNAGHKRAVLVQAVRAPEENSFLSKLNEPYHKRRAEISNKKEEGSSSSSSSSPFRVHTFFTMDCTDHSVWQAGTLEYSWEKVGQEGFLSRIISGCETAPKIKVERTQKHFLSSDEVAWKRRGSFYAPYASTLPSGRHYAPFNRPHSVYYWLKHADLTEEVFVMIDPDMVFLNKLPTESVRLGNPMSQIYDYMETTEFETYKCESCPQNRFDRRPYAVGPPWMMHLSDWIRVTPRWIKICQELAESQPTNWIAEMIAYSLACKVENLPHSLTYKAMVDNIDDAVVWDANDRLTLSANEESYSLFSSNVAKKNQKSKKRPRDQVHLKKSTSTSIINSDGEVEFFDSDLPSTLHYCYTLEVGEIAPNEQSKYVQHQRMKTRDLEEPSPVLDYYHFSKYRVPTDWPGGKAKYDKNFMDCQTPILQEFHSFGYLLDEVFDAPGTHKKNFPQNSDNNNNQKQNQQQQPTPPASSYRSSWRRSAVMLELLIPSINDAMTVYKNRYCEARERNLSKQLRTTHPGFFISRWNLDDWDSQGRDVKFHLVGRGSD